MLLQLIEKTGIPFITTQLGKGVIDETPPQVPRLRRAVGRRLRPPGDRGRRPDRQCRPRRDREAALLHEAGRHRGDPRQTNTAEVDPVYFPQIEVIGDIANAIWQIKEDIVPSGTWNFDAMLRPAPPRSSTPRRCATTCASRSSRPAWSSRSARRCRPTASSASTTASTRSGSRATIRRAQPNTVLLDNALATMGAGLPSAMASAMVYPDRKVMAICGDGGFMMNSQEMETAVRLRLNITVLILRDDAYGMIRWKQANMGFADFGLTYGNPDFVKYAESYGANGHRVDSAEALPDLLRALPRHARRPPDRLPGRLFGERPDPQQGHQGAERGAVTAARRRPGPVTAGHGSRPSPGCDDQAEGRLPALPRQRGEAAERRPRGHRQIYRRGRLPRARRPTRRRSTPASPRAVEAAEPMARMAELRAPGGAPALRRPLQGAVRRARLSRSASRPASRSRTARARSPG